MKKTPNKISEKRQRIGREIESWRAKIASIRGSLPLLPVPRAQIEQQVAFCEKEIQACRKRMAAIRYKGRKPWTFKAR